MKRESTINLTKISLSPNDAIADGYLKPAKNEIVENAVEDHTSEPIKSLDEINRVIKFLLSKKRYRDYCLFVCGINFGLRVSDLISLRYSDLFHYDEESDTYYFKKTFAILEQKTKTTRKRRVNRYITINEAVKEAVTLYLSTLSEMPCLDGFIFVSQSPKDKTVAKNRSKNYKPHLTRRSALRIMTGIADALDLPEKIGTHSLRKTFAYHQLLAGNNDQRKLILIQKMLGHSSLAETLRYVGITRDEIEQAYLDCPLGLLTGEYEDDGAENITVSAPFGTTDAADYTSGILGHLAA